MKDIWFRYATDTVSVGPEEASSGILPTDPTSETSSGTYTEWTLQLTDGSRHVVKVPGSNGRISYSNDPRSGGATVRFYRDATTKQFDAVIPGVMSIRSGDVRFEDPPMSKEEAYKKEVTEKMKLMMEEKAKERTLKEITEAIVRREYADDGKPMF